MAWKKTNDTYYGEIASAIRSKNGTNSTYQPSQMANAISALPECVDEEAALVLIDWEGTLLRSYTREEVMALTELPNPTMLPNYAYADHELLVFQEWTNTLQYVKDYLQNRPYGHITIGAIYTTSDGQNHYYWTSDRANRQDEASIIKFGLMGNINVSYYKALQKISIPSGVVQIKASNASTLKHINLPSTITNVSFYNCTGLQSFNLPDEITGLDYNSAKERDLILPKSLQIISASVFSSNTLLTKIEIPDTVIEMQSSCFTSCTSLSDVVIKGKPIARSYNLFLNGSSVLKIYVPQANLSWFSTETNWAYIYSQYQFVTIEDNIDYLERLGFNVDKYKEAA